MQVLPREFGLRQAFLVALLLHLLLMWKLVIPVRIDSAALVAQEPAPEPLEFVFVQPDEPREFAFVDVPDDREAVPPEETNVVSDRNRRAAGGARPDSDRPTGDPYSEGQTEVRVAGNVGRDLLASGAPSAPSAATPPAQPSPPTPQPRPAQAASETAEEGPGERESAQRTSEADRQATEDRRMEAVREALRDTLGPPSTQELLQDASPQLRIAEGRPQFRNLDTRSSRFDAGLSFDTAWFEWGDYWRRIYLIIYRAWVARLPPATPSLSGVSVVRFYINRDGTTSGVELITSYGSQAVHPEIREKNLELLDAAAVDTLRSVRLPPLPEDFPFEREGVTGTFIVRQIR